VLLDVSTTDAPGLSHALFTGWTEFCVRHTTRSEQSVGLENNPVLSIKFAFSLSFSLVVLEGGGFMATGEG
jgi:hypothetical protein